MSGMIVNPGKDHRHKFKVVLTAYMEYAIRCKRWRCRYKEINPNGLMAQLIRRT